MNDPTEAIRRERLAEINTVCGSREALEAQYGKVWDTQELRQEFEVIGFLAPFVVVRRKSDGQKGSVEFQHHPRMYFNFVLDGRSK
jgi:endo-1,4-beta-D-glucanase Y